MPGDIIGFSSSGLGGYASHIGIYVGDGMMIHCACIQAMLLNIPVLILIIMLRVSLVQEELFIKFNIKMRAT